MEPSPCPIAFSLRGPSDGDAFGSKAAALRERLIVQKLIGTTCKKVFGMKAAGYLKGFEYFKTVDVGCLN